MRGCTAEGVHVARVKVRVDADGREGEVLLTGVGEGTRDEFRTAARVYLRSVGLTPTEPIR